MKKSPSSPCLHNLNAASKPITLKRNISAYALTELAVAEMVVMSNVPINQAFNCVYMQDFPSDLMSKPVVNEEMIACLMSPPEYDDPQESTNKITMCSTETDPQYSSTCVRRRENDQVVDGCGQDNGDGNK